MNENAGQNHEKDKTRREGDDKYRQLFTQMLNGYALHEIICDDQGQPIDPGVQLATGILNIIDAAIQNGR